MEQTLYRLQAHSSTAKAVVLRPANLINSNMLIARWFMLPKKFHTDYSFKEQNFNFLINLQYKQAIILDIQNQHEFSILS